MGCLVVSEACCWLALTSVWNILGRRNCERDGHGGLQPFTSFLISWYFQQAVEIRRATKSTNFRISFFWFKITLLNLKMPSLKSLMEIKLVLSAVSAALQSRLHLVFLFMTNLDNLTCFQSESDHIEQWQQLNCTNCTNHPAAILGEISPSVQSFRLTARTGSAVCQAACNQGCHKFSDFIFIFKHEQVRAWNSPCWTFLWKFRLSIFKNMPVPSLVPSSSRR